MKLLTVFSTTVLAVLVGISAPVFAQDEPHPQEEKRTAPDDKAAHPGKQEDKQVDKDKEKENKQVDKEKDNKQAVQENTQDEKSAHPEEQGERREGKEGGRIPEDVFGLTLAGSTLFKLAGRSSSQELLASSMAAIGL